MVILIKANFLIKMKEDNLINQIIIIKDKVIIMPLKFIMELLNYLDDITFSLNLDNS